VTVPEVEVAVEVTLLVEARELDSTVVEVILVLLVVLVVLVVEGVQVVVGFCHSVVVVVDVAVSSPAPQYQVIGNTPIDSGAKCWNRPVVMSREPNAQPGHSSWTTATAVLPWPVMVRLSPQ